MACASWGMGNCIPQGTTTARPATLPSPHQLQCGCDVIQRKLLHCNGNLAFDEQPDHFGCQFGLPGSLANHVDGQDPDIAEQPVRQVQGEALTQGVSDQGSPATGDNTRQKVRQAVAAKSVDHGVDGRLGSQHSGKFVALPDDGTHTFRKQGSLIFARYNTDNLGGSGKQSELCCHRSDSTGCSGDNNSFAGSDGCNVVDGNIAGCAGQEEGCGDGR